jgi:hypothetical protein
MESCIIANFRKKRRSKRRVWKSWLKKYGSYETLNWIDPYPWAELFKNKAKYYRRDSKLETRKLLKEY